MNFLNKHPFIKSLLKVQAYIAVSFNTVMLCFVGLGLLITAIAIAIFAIGGFDASTITGSHVAGNADSYNKLLSIKVGGTIIGDNDDTSGIGYYDQVTSGYDVKDQLYEAADDDGIQGVVLEINSPGGTIYGAHAIADGVKYYREQTDKPVYAYVQGIAASGAYWSAVSTDKIIADYGSSVGSIGVVVGPFRYYDKVLSDESGVVTQNGIQDVTITAGKSKDYGNPYRKLTQEEVNNLQTSVNNDYDTFVKYVSDRRKIPEATIRDQIGALVYDNKSAQSLKLIDQTGSRQDTYDQLAKAAKLDLDDYEVIRDEAFGQDFASDDWTSVFSFAKKRQASNQTASGQKQDLCKITQSSMAYYGDVTGFCKQD